MNLSSLQNYYAMHFTTAILRQDMAEIATANPLPEIRSSGKVHMAFHLPFRYTLYLD
jgi:hypothetical protein